MSETGGGRYTRTTNGLLGSMIVTVLIVLVFVGFRALDRENPAYEVTSVDYFEAVDAAQGAGLRVTYPADLPVGWVAHTIDYDPTGDLVFGIGILTDSGTFVGLHQENASSRSLLSAYVDDNPVEGDPLRVSGSVASSWNSWSDSGGDHAYTAKVGEATVMVFGSASIDDLQLLLGELTSAPHGETSPEPFPS